MPALGKEAVPAAMGVFYVFRDETEGQGFLSRSFRRRVVAPRGDRASARYEAHREILSPLIAKTAELGRLPEPDECPHAEEIIDRFGTLKRAFGVIKQATGEIEWETITKRASEDLLVYLALGKSQGRPPLSALPLGFQRDLRAFFGGYKKACATSDKLLFSAGDPDAVDEACRRTKVGKILPEAIYVHESALDQLDPLLRTCAGITFIIRRRKIFLGRTDFSLDPLMVSIDISKVRFS